MAEKAIWAKWKVHENGRVDVVLTYAENDGYAQRAASYDSLDQAAEALGTDFRAVVEGVMLAGSYTGRWRP